MAGFFIELISAVCSLMVLLIIWLYLYPTMKKEWGQKRRDWRYYYDVCGDEYRQPYRKILYAFLTHALKK